MRDGILLRIYLGESDRYEGKPLYRYIVEFLRKEGIAGATVLRGMLGYGKSSVIHNSSVLRLSSDLPVVVEVVDTVENIERVKRRLVEIVREGLITEERVKIISYSGREPK
ncbi:hypothetical protein GAH_00982 [Geoglobus ahangari]|uniref:Uncharacterized protein n=1 Tax=Geoglobus ahangari TaxID=113653 RepID=A0A0F7IGD7_9EURY|nr:DUF190 domain-containing protein [Geoglobus ahangari]AKG91693.1 hypothetical protein GAH_00982 [Geoglobus ahangari]